MVFEVFAAKAGAIKLVKVARATPIMSERFISSSSNQWPRGLSVKYLSF
jgi:hypothetical protein